MCFQAGTWWAQNSFRTTAISCTWLQNW